MYLWIGKKYPRVLKKAFSDPLSHFQLISVFVSPIPPPSRPLHRYVSSPRLLEDNPEIAGNQFSFKSDFWCNPQICPDQILEFVSYHPQDMYPFSSGYTVGYASPWKTMYPPFAKISQHSLHVEWGSYSGTMYLFSLPGLEHFPFCWLDWYFLPISSLHLIYSLSLCL